MSEKLFVGYARVDITPTESVPLRGYGNTAKRMSQAVKDPLYLTAIVFTDEAGGGAMLLPVDLCSCSNKVMGPMREAISQETGIPVQQILFSATHNHSGPDIINFDVPSIPRYNAMLAQRALEAAKAAMADRKEVTGLYTSDIATKRLNFVRNYILEDGSAAGPNYGYFDRSPIRCHESEVDSQLQLVKITRQGGKDLVLANFQTHPHRTGGSKVYNVSSDLVEYFRQSVEERLDCLSAYLTGGSGNVDPTSRIREENFVCSYVGHGQMLADYAVKAAQSFQPVGFGPVTARHLNREYPCNHAYDHLVEVAAKIRKEWGETGDFQKAKADGAPYGIHSPYHAGSIVWNAKLPETRDIDQWTFAIGDVAFVGAPYEMFDTNGKFIKDNSPYAMTFICTCTNASYRYIPSSIGFKNGGYSVDACEFCPGIGEQLADSYLEMLRDQKG